MKTICTILIVCLLFTQGLRYSYQVWTREISPTLSTWITFLVGVGISLVTFLIAEQRDVWAGMLNIADFVVVVMITTTIILRGERTVLLRPFEKKYLLVAGVIVLYAILFADAFRSNLFAQILVSAGYIPLIATLRSEQRNTESFSGWLLAIAGGLVGFLQGLLEGNTLAIIYAARSTLCCAIILCLMAYYHERRLRLLRD